MTRYQESADKYIIAYKLMTRNLSFDLLRILACLMVIMMHAQPISSNPNGMILAVSSYATAPCIGLFFMLSGALRLSRPISNFRIYFNISSKDSLTSALVESLLWHHGVILQGLPWTEWTTFRFILKMNNPTLWFIFPLLGLYIITPILQAWIESSSRQHQRFYLMLWGGTLCLPWFKQIFPIEEGVTSLFYYFSGYIGYYLLGSYLTKYASQLTRYSIVALLLAWGTPTGKVVATAHRFLPNLLVSFCVRRSTMYLLDAASSFPYNL